MSEFSPKRLCWFSEVPGGAYEAAEPKKTEQKNQKDLSDLSQQVESAQKSPETAQEKPDDISQETAQKAIEREEKNLRTISKLEGKNPTESMIKMKLVEKSPTREYIERTDHKDLQSPFLVLQQTTRERIRNI